MLRLRCQLLLLLPCPAVVYRFPKSIPVAPQASKTTMLRRKVDAPIMAHQERLRLLLEQRRCSLRHPLQPRMERPLRQRQLRMEQRLRRRQLHRFVPHPALQGMPAAYSVCLATSVWVQIDALHRKAGCAPPTARTPKPGLLRRSGQAQYRRRSTRAPPSRGCGRLRHHQRAKSAPSFFPPVRTSKESLRRRERHLPRRLRRHQQLR